LLVAVFLSTFWQPVTAIRLEDKLNIKNQNAKIRFLLDPCLRLAGTCEIKDRALLLRPIRLNSGQALLKAGYGMQ
jgi:hypothetical protein